MSEDMLPSEHSVNWTVQYCKFLRESAAGRHDRPTVADHAYARAQMSKFALPAVPPPTSDEVLRLMAQERIAVFEDNGKWYALPSDKLSTWIRDQDGNQVQAAIYEEDVIPGINMTDAILSCFVRIVISDMPERMP